MTREKTVRMAYFNALSGNLTWEGTNVPVFDSKVEQNDVKVYVLFCNQTTQPNSGTAYDCFVWDSDITIKIICLFEDGVSKDVFDEIGEQIETIILTDSPAGSGLVDPDELYQLDNVYLRSASYDVMEYDGSGYYNTNAKTLIFSQTIQKI